ncbi:MAG: DUF2782 domain-containing protein [Gammaproteobacteria bacterium]|nr:DUF2782 domain-containing protein [Gammaproteobacteria bacterium]NIR83360.1 DUF2782 domain-containing protein [Gammaproteobacteria bacterium]NIR91160.1 DUF2782 domain-containing protein [Gammaproteobacteria bacterium]NIU04527.1 DUF2782 domain-containing protein [Gammaproteobacteria bacterium]NIW87163.1 DUF2782 domain-containing protein [Gammaproteobacteria bacterium]
MPGHRFLASLALCALLASSVLAQSKPKDLQPAPEPPPLPDSVRSGEALEPEITIVPKDDRVIHEYRLNGQLYAIKVVPSKGPAYYLVDVDGDGRLDTRRNDLAAPILIPAWVILRW